MRTGWRVNDLEVVMRIALGGVIAMGMALVLATTHTTAQTATPYKLGMFEQNGRTFVGLVIQNDTQVIDLSRANVGASATLKQLIAGWDAKIGAQLASLARSEERRVGKECHVGWAV